MRRKLLKKAAASTLAVCMLGSTVLSGIPALRVLAEDPADVQWQQIQDVVSRYYGEWKNTNYSGLISKRLPNTALLGNGDVGVASGGNENSKSFYISKGDFWTYGTGSFNDPCPPLPIGGVTIQKQKKTVEESDNLVLNKPVVVSGEIQGENGKLLADGNSRTKWCSTPKENADGSEKYWAMLDLEQEREISRWVVRHAQAGGESSNYNTRDFTLQYAVKENPDPAVDADWVDADVVTGNTESVTERNLNTAIKARYVRLLVTKPTQNTNPAVRIYELELYAEPKEESTPFYEKQDILNAEIQTTQELADVPTEMTTWLSDDKNIMVTELTSKGRKDAEFQVDTWATDNERTQKPITAENDEDSVTVTRCTPNMDTDPANKDAYISKAALATKVIGVDEVAASSDNSNGKGTLKFTLEAGETVYIVTAVGGGGRTYHNDGSLWEDAVEPTEDAEAVLSEVSDEKAVQELNADRQEWWKDFWGASYVDFGTEDEDLNKIQKYYYGAQYILGSTAKEGELAPGLYGIWHTQDDASWSSDYHLNYNFIATFYGTNSSNRPEIALPGVEALLDYVPEGQRRASSTEELKRIRKDFVEQKVAKGDIDPVNGIPGAILFPVGIGPWGTTTDNTYHNEALDAAYNSYLMTQYYDYTLDETFLESGTYEFMKQAVAFYEAWLEKETKGDSYEYVLYAGYNEGSWAKNPGVELAALKSTLKHLIAASEDLGKDADKRGKWIDIYEHLGDQPTTIVNGKKVLALGEKQWNGSSWVDLTSPIPGDGNAIPLDAVIPGGVYTYFSPEEELQVVQDTIDVFSARGAWGQINNFPRLFPEAVKSRYPINTVVEKLVNVIDSQMAPNLRINDGVHGVEKCGSTETINSMMLISEDGINKIFPNWYEDKDAKFANLRAKDAFTVSAEYDGAAQEAKNVEIKSEKGKTMTLVSPWDVGAHVLDSKGNVVEVTRGTVPNWEEEKTITFDTVAGETYYIEKGEKPGEPIPEIYPIPGTLEAEAYQSMSGVEVVDGAVTEIHKNDWMEYNVKVASNEKYDVNFTVALEKGKTADFDVMLDGKFVKAVTLESTDDEWQTFKASMNLKKGVHKIRVISRTDGWKLDKMAFAKAEKAISTRVEAEDYTNKYGDVKKDGLGLGYISVGDWMEYKVTVPTPGTYKMNYRVAVNKNPGKVKVSINGETVGQVEFPSTGGWGNWTDVGAEAEFAEAGEYTIRFDVLASGWNFDYFTLMKEVKEVDKTELEALYGEYCNFVQGNYTDASWQVFTDALNAIRKILVDDSASQEQADAVAAAMKDAAANLEENLDDIESVFTITVNGEATEHKYNDAVTIETPAEKDGKKFSCWMAGDEIVSYETTYKFYVSKSMEFKAVYVDVSEEVKKEAQAILTNVFVTKRADEKSDVKFVGELVIPDGYELVNAGLVWSSKEGTELVLGGGLKPTYIKKISDTNQFSVTIKGMPQGKFIRGSVFATITNGIETKVIYSAEERAEAK